MSDSHVECLLECEDRLKVPESAERTTTIVPIDAYRTRCIRGDVAFQTPTVGHKRIGLTATDPSSSRPLLSSVLCPLPHRTGKAVCVQYIWKYLSRFLQRSSAPEVPQ